MSQELAIPASPNWYCSSTSACNGHGLYAFAARNQIFVFDICGDYPVFKDSVQIHKERVTSLCWIEAEKAGDFYVGCGGEDGFIRIIDYIGSKSVVSEQKKHSAKISSVVCSGKNTIVSGDEKGLLLTWNFLTGGMTTWLPVSSTIFSLAASPQQEGLIAVGYANGHVLIADIKKCEVIRQYKSHLDEVHSVMWEPLLNNSEGKFTDHSFESGLLLASGSKDKTIRIWSIQNESPILTLDIPSKGSNQKGRKKVDEMGRAKIWIALCWQKKDTLISSSCTSGDLLIWDLKTKDFRYRSPGHTRIIFNINIDVSTKKIVTTSMDRQIILWDSDTYDLISSMPSIGGYIYSVSSSYLDPYSIIYGVGDNVIRVWNTRCSNNPYETNILWQGLKSKVTVVECHPKKESIIGFGTDDGHVGIYNVTSRKFEVSVSYHRKTVYSVSWGPNCGNDDEAGTTEANWLFSCGGEGSILIHSMNSLQNKAKDMNSIIRKTNAFKEKLPSRSDIEWKRDLKFVAVGNDDGSVHIFASPNLQIICTILVHRKIINCMKWHHQFDIAANEEGSGFSNWIATGSSDNYICVTDLTSAIGGKINSEKQVIIKEKFRYFNLHTQRITGLAWSPHSVELLASSSYDGSIQVWNVNQNEPVANFRGHGGRVLCVLWSLVHPDVIYSGSEDFTLRRWHVSSCKHNLPKGIQKQATNPSKKNEKIKSQPLAPQSPPGTLVSSESEGHITTLDTDENRLENGNLYEDVLKAVQDPSIDRISVTKTESSSKPSSAAALLDLKSRSSNKIDSKKKKPKSLFPLAASQNHKQKAASQKECILLTRYLKGEPSLEDVDSDFEPGKSNFVNLGLFGDRQSAYKMYSTEGQNHADSGNFDQQLHLDLWKGNLGGALKACKQKGELNEMIVAMSPLGGYEVWESTMKAYADQQASKGDFATAASYYVAINKVTEAINMLKGQNMFNRFHYAIAKELRRPHSGMIGSREQADALHEADLSSEGNHDLYQSA